MTAKVLEFERQEWQARWKKSHSGNDPMNERFVLVLQPDLVMAWLQQNAALLPNNNQGDQTRWSGIIRCVLSLSSLEMEIKTV